MKERIAIVKSAANKSRGLSLSDRKRQIAANATKVTDVIKTATTRLRNMLSKIKKFVRFHADLLATYSD